MVGARDKDASWVQTFRGFSLQPPSAAEDPGGVPEAAGGITNLIWEHLRIPPGGAGNFFRTQIGRRIN